MRASYISSPINIISFSFMPLEVIAGVPILNPLVINGDAGSNGIVFLFTVIFTESKIDSASLPVIFKDLKVY